MKGVLTLSLKEIDRLMLISQIVRREDSSIRSSQTFRT